MKTGTGTMLMLAVCLSFTFATAINAQEIESLKGIETVKAVFDVRNNNPQKTERIMKLIQTSYEELLAAGKKPDFKVVFMGPSVKLLSSTREGFGEEDQKPLDAIVESISGLSKKGIGFEICKVAMKSAGVDPKTVQAEITPVDNGWFSSIGYQTQGYALVPLY